MCIITLLAAVAALRRHMHPFPKVHVFLQLAVAGCGDKLLKVIVPS